jgi:hypothetical protein
MKAPKIYENRYAYIMRTLNGNWALFNNVSGLFIREVPTYEEARNFMRETYQYYAAME